LWNYELQFVLQFTERIMSKENVFEFLVAAAEDEHLKDKLQTVTNEGELANVGQEEGFEFSSEHVEEALTELKRTPGFFSALAEAVLGIFAPSRDDYPVTGVQPFTGEPSHRS
jgi:predicted ribosomally synthesized peptide with nif11-like leader